jgi:hypothetical protein
MVHMKKLITAVGLMFAMATAANAHLIGPVLYVDPVLPGPGDSPASEQAWVRDTLGIDGALFLYKVVGEAGDPNLVPGGSFTVTGIGETEGTVSWDLTGTGYQLSAVLVKGGQNYNVYTVSSDQLLMNLGDPEIILGPLIVANGPEGRRHEISHVSFFGIPGNGEPPTGVPDGGSTLLLLGSAVTFLGLYARRRRTA